MKKIRFAVCKAVLLFTMFFLILTIGTTAKEIFAKADEAVKPVENIKKVQVIEEEMVYMSPEVIPGWDSAFLVLANKDTPLDREYNVKLQSVENGVGQVSEDIVNDLTAMLRAGNMEGHEFWLASTYRSYERQEQLLEEDVRELMGKGYDRDEAYAEAIKETMPPGCSEHETGLAVDIVAKNYQMLDANQETTCQNIWLRAHCHEYGFILRYPKEKEDVTGISYESWHFRYVGVEAATYITENNLTLEEYLEKIEANKVIKQVKKTVW